MARLPRFSPAGIPQHIIQRGNNRQVCFGSDQDMAVYARWLEQYAQEHHVSIHAWVFMTNHVHLLATPLVDNAISAMMQGLGRRYVRYFNRAYLRSGTLWEGRFRSGLVQASDYLLNCQRYIELNPVRAGMVDNPAAYFWSSFRCHALGVKAKMHTPHREYLSLDRHARSRQRAYRDLFKTPLDGVSVDTIRNAVNAGLAVGDDRFKDELEALHGRRLRPANKGRPSAIGAGED